MINLYPHQQNKIDKNTPKCLINFGTGTGKTTTALELAQHNNVNALIICPKSLKKMWEENTKRYPKQTHMILTKEEFKRDHKTLPRFNAIIVDEVHHFSGKSSALSKSLEKYIKTHNPHYVWLCTATAYRSTPWNIQRIATFLGKAKPYTQFINEYFYHVNMGGRMIPMIKSGIEDKIADWVRELADGDVVAMSDVVEVPEQTFETEYLELTEEQKKGITDLDDSTFIARFTHTHCIENGLLHGDGYTEDKSFECNKTKRILELAQSVDKIAIVCRYNAQIAYYKSLLPDAFVINGEIKDRHAVVQAIEASPRAVVLIQAQCSEGYELPSVGLIVFASMSWSYLDYVQCIGRFLRINRLKKNKYIHLVIKDGYDEDIYNCIMQKKDFDIAIYEKKMV